MKYNVRDLKGYTITTVDGSEGKIKDILFDEDSWTVRYCETDFGNIFNSNRILIPVEILTNAGSQSKGFKISLSRSDLEKYPKPEKNNFLSRRYEEQLSSFYGTSSYWNSVPISRSDSGTGMGSDVGSSTGSSTRAASDVGTSKDVGTSSGLGSGSTGSSATSSKATGSSATRDTGLYAPRSIRSAHESGSDSSLHSFNDVTDYSIQAIDGKLGHIEDLIIDQDNWHISHVVVDTANWLPWGKKVILSINQIQDISYNTKEARINLNVDTIKNAPEYDSSKPFSEQYEHSLHDYYERTYVK